jgi:hypothetical protein
MEIGAGDWLADLPSVAAIQYMCPPDTSCAQFLSASHANPTMFSAPAETWKVGLPS